MIQVFLAILMLQNAAAKPTAESCSRVDPRKVPLGQSCLTSKGHEFILMHRSESGNEAWLDKASSILWGDKLTERIRRRAAKDLCKKEISGENRFGEHHLATLPTLEEFNAAETRGFREVLPNMKDHFYWIDSSVPGAKNIGHVFNGNVGKPEIVVYRSINFENVRCIDRSRIRKK